MTKNRKIKNTIFKIVEKIKEEYRPEKIILFGSYAYGTPNKNTDVDLFILKPTKKSRIDRFVEVKRIIYDPKIELVFSPLVYTPKEVKGRISLGDDFVRDILETTKEIIEEIKVDVNYKGFPTLLVDYP